MNKEQAAAALGITVRTLQRHMAAHRIGFAMRKTATGEEATFQAEEVARFKAQRDALTETVTPAANVLEVVRAPSQAIEHVSNSQTIAALGRLIADALQATQTHANGTGGAVSITDLAHKLTLSLVEASQLSGLSRNHLRAAIAEKKLKARIIGRGWKMSRAELEGYTAKLLK
jgi:excisionase family DNA binding protein